MDIKGVSATAVATAIRPAVAVQPVVPQAVVVPAKTENVVAAGSSDAVNNEQLTGKEDKESLSKKNVEEITEGLNDFMQSINTDLKFVLHQKTDQLMVQVVDTKTHKILREAPPKELLDTLARIRDFVGALLDKKA